MDEREEPQVCDDDFPEFVVSVTDPGPNRSTLFLLYRQTRCVDPATAARLLRSTRVEVARGPRMCVQPVIDRFRAAGATVEVIP